MVLDVDIVDEFSVTLAVSAGNQLLIVVSSCSQILLEIVSLKDTSNVGMGAGGGGSVDFVSCMILFDRSL